MGRSTDNVAPVTPLSSRNESQLDPGPRSLVRCLASAHGLMFRLHGRLPWSLRAWRLLRWYLLMAAHPQTSVGWLRWLDQPFPRACARVHPQLLLKPLRPYISRRWGAARRAHVIAETHRIALMQPLLSRALLRPVGLRLLRGAITNDTAWQVRLGRNGQFHKEGELVLSLHDMRRGRPLYCLSFAFDQDATGAIHCYIGALQGRANSAEAIKSMTRVFHGVRPTILLWRLTCDIARSVGASSLLGASNAIQVHVRKHLIRLSGIHDLHRDYDASWRDLGGCLDEEGWYRLPLDVSRRAAADIPSRKRAQYRRRYEWLDGIDAEVCRQLTDSDADRSNR